MAIPTFVDRVRLHVAAGRGGNGVASVHREKFKPLGGPDGGNGGPGGSVILRVDPDVTTLLDYHHSPRRKAGVGGHGAGGHRNGAHGADLVLPVPDGIGDNLRQALLMAMVISLGWLATGCVYVFQEFMLRRYDLKAANNIRARRVHTQFQLFRRILITFIVIITIGGVLWTFNDPRIWHYGSGLLASAGIALLLPVPALAQTSAPQAAPRTDEILVTGTRRETTLQDTDTAITVLDRRTIQEARLRDVRRLDDLVPNVQFNENGQLSNIFITIRGVESNPFIVNRAAPITSG